MIQDKFNMVDMGGIDIIRSQGVAVSGLYQNLVESITLCRYTNLYNWKFAGILIPPVPVELVVEDGVVKINNGIEVDEDDVIHIYSIEPAPIEPVITELIADENGVYEAPEGVDGFNPVRITVPIPEPGPSEYVLDFFDIIAPKYSGGYEYSGYIYNTELVATLSLDLLADASQGEDSVVLANSISDYSGILLQGIYQKNRVSQYNTTIMYLDVSENVEYWAGMKDRNNSYTCKVTFTSDTTASLTGNKQVIIYGIR